MKELGKILMYALPAGLETALLQQFAADSAPDIVVAKAGEPPAGPFDLVIHTGADKGLKLPPGTPVLPVVSGKPQRLGVILRQAQQMLGEPALYLDDFSIGPYLFRPQDKLLEREGEKDISLTDRETDILVYLAKRSGGAVGREDLLRHVWRYQEGVDTHTLETHIYRLRQKIESSADDPALLVTEAGGYRLNL